MRLIRSAASALIRAPASRVDSLSADPRDGQPRIRPREQVPRLDTGWAAPGLRGFIERGVMPPLRRIDHRELIRLSAAVLGPEAGGETKDERSEF